MKHMIKRILIALFLCGLVLNETSAQNLSLDSCQAMAKRNYPLIRQFELIEKSKEYSVENIQKGYLPQVNVSGYSTYQSDILTFPFTIPGSELEPLRQDQHRIYGEINQPITDLFNVKNQKGLVEINAQVENQKMEIELYKLKDRVNQLFFGILLIDAQVQQLEILKKDIHSGIAKTSTAIENGIALKSSLDILKVELLKADQKHLELKANRKAYLQMMSLLTEQELSENSVLEIPKNPTQVSAINRPELRLFDLQNQSFAAQSKLLTNKTLPKLNFFFQGGLGAPGLNIIDNSAAAYYITGLRLNWSISSFYTNKKEKSLQELNQRGVLVQREAFLLNTDITLRQQNTEIEKMENLILSDGEIIQMRGRIKTTTQNQLENGTATTNDYLIQLNAEDQAKQNQILHQIQLLMAQYNYQTTSGN
jgi:outer membrane protein TolC